jgi:hypothetical protein
VARGVFRERRGGEGLALDWPPHVTTQAPRAAPRAWSTKGWPYTGSGGDGRNWSALNSAKGFTSFQCGAMNCGVAALPVVGSESDRGCHVVTSMTVSRSVGADGVGQLDVQAQCAHLRVKPGLHSRIGHQRCGGAVDGVADRDALVLLGALRHRAARRTAVPVPW